MDLRLLIIMVRRWAWLLVLGLVLGLGAGYLATTYQTPLYEASTKLLIMRTPQNASDSYLTSLGDQQLANTYTQLVRTKLVLDVASERLGYEVSAGQITLWQIENTQIIELKVQDASPQRAADIANMLVEVVIEQNDALLASRYALSEETLETQIEQVETQMTALQTELNQISDESVQRQRQEVEAQIESLQRDIATLQAEIDELNPPVGAGTPAPLLSSGERTLLSEKQARLDLLQSTLSSYQRIFLNLTVGGGSEGGLDLQGQVGQLQTTLALYQQIYTSLISNREQIRLARLQNTASVLRVEEAVPANPDSPLPMVPWTAIGGAIGLTLAATLAFLLEYLNDTLKTPGDIARVLELPVIGFVAEIQGDKERPYVAEQPRSPIAEAFRSLRTNLEFAAVEKPLRSVLVTSVGSGEGKTTTATNLAIAMAQGGKRVVLLDADLRRPRIHRFFNLSNRVGLSEVFRDHVKLEDALQQTIVGGLSVITSGSIPPNPAELLGSEKMTNILDQLLAATDVVIIDSPPFLVADASVLAAKVDGVLLVIQPGKTNANAAMAMQEQLQRGSARIVGVTLNRIPRRRAYYYGGYRYYYSPYYAYGNRDYGVEGLSENSNGHVPAVNGNGHKGRLPALLGRRKENNHNSEDSK
jgi:capsular exopolysaccharide synthesis family protein